MIIFFLVIIISKKEPPLEHIARFHVRNSRSPVIGAEATRTTLFFFFIKKKKKRKERKKEKGVLLLSPKSKKNFLIFPVTMDHGKVRRLLQETHDAHETFLALPCPFVMLYMSK